MVTRDAVLRGLAITPGDFVVEVGGGHNPFWRADLIVEKYPFDSGHRTDKLIPNAPVIIADAVRLPLPDRGCDLLFASHVLEHVPEPQQFLTEIKRCSHRVYLEFPGFRRELMFAWSFHQWVIEVQGTHLVFYRNDLPQLFGDFFHRHYDFVLDAWTTRRHAALNNWVSIESALLSWEFARQGALQHALESSPRNGAKVNAAPLERIAYGWRQIVMLGVQGLLPGLRPGWGSAVLGRWRHRAPKPLRPALVRRLACQRCRSALRLQATEIVCDSCKAVYHERNGLFDFDVDPEDGRPAL
jgi:SAM-dependent methyltransferase